MKTSMPIHCGLRALSVWDTVQKANVPVTVLYPANDPETSVNFGPYSIEAAVDATPTLCDLPLVVLSHGNGSTPWAFRDLAKHLAKSGFAIALPEHTGNSRNDNTLAQTLANLENRPRHITLTIDAVLADVLLCTAIRRSGVGIIGHSIGAYTALTVAGGHPWAGAHETKDGKPAQVVAQQDKRISALALLMPACFWFPENSLRDVRLPVLIRTGTMDKITPASPHADLIIEGVADPSLVEHQSISGAGHHSAMSKFPAALTSPDFPPSQDPAGFERELYQPTLFADIERFLRAKLT
jgi:predicted dienelactone hydrolase